MAPETLVGSRCSIVFFQFELGLAERNRKAHSVRNADAIRTGSAPKTDEVR